MPKQLRSRFTVHGADEAWLPFSSCSDTLAAVNASVRRRVASDQSLLTCGAPVCLPLHPPLTWRRETYLLTRGENCGGRQQQWSRAQYTYHGQTPHLLCCRAIVRLLGNVSPLACALNRMVAASSQSARLRYLAQNREEWDQNNRARGSGADLAQGSLGWSAHERLVARGWLAHAGAGAFAGFQKMSDVVEHFPRLREAHSGVDARIE